MKWNAGKLMWLRFIVSLFLFYAQQFYVLNNLVTEIFSAVARTGLLEPNLGNVFQGKTLPLVMSFPKKIPAVISTRLSWTSWGNKVLPAPTKYKRKKQHTNTIPKEQDIKTNASGGNITKPSMEHETYFKENFLGKYKVPEQQLKAPPQEMMCQKINQ